MTIYRSFLFSWGFFCLFFYIGWPHPRLADTHTQAALQSQSVLYKMYSDLVVTCGSGRPEAIQKSACWSASCSPHETTSQVQPERWSIWGLKLHICPHKLGRIKTDNALSCSGISGTWGDVLHTQLGTKAWAKRSTEGRGQKKPAENIKKKTVHLQEM